MIEESKKLAYFAKKNTILYHICNFLYNYKYISEDQDLKMFWIFILDELGKNFPIYKT